MKYFLLWVAFSGKDGLILFVSFPNIFHLPSNHLRGWSGGAMVLGKLPVPGRPTIWMIVEQEPIELAVGAGGGCFDILLSSILFLFFTMGQKAAVCALTDIVRPNPFSAMRV